MDQMYTVDTGAEMTLVRFDGTDLCGCGHRTGIGTPRDVETGEAFRCVGKDIIPRVHMPEEITTTLTMKPEQMSPATKPSSTNRELINRTAAARRDGTDLCGCSYRTGIGTSRVFPLL